MSVTSTSPNSTPSPARAKAPKRRRLRQLTRRDKIVLGFMVGIPTLIQVLLVWLPTVASVFLSFTKWDGIGLERIENVGTRNYDFVFTDYTPFWPAVQHNVVWLLCLGFIATPVGLLLAVLLDRNIRGSRIYQSIFFTPVMLSLALVGVIWQLMYMRDQGLINNLLGIAGTPQAVDWLGDSNINIWAAILAACWRHSGYIMLLYLAGLKGVDPSLREAASLDGAGPWQTFWRVVFPAMKGTNIVIFVITVIESLRAFDIAWVINKGRNGLELLSTLVVQNLIGEGAQIGNGSAIAVVLMLISLVPIVIYLSRAFKEEK